MKTLNTYICVKCNKQFDTYIKDAYYCDVCAGRTIDISKLPEKKFRRSVQTWNEYANKANARLLASEHVLKPVSAYVAEKTYKLPHSDKSLTRRIVVR